MKLLLKISICISLTISQCCQAQETAFKSRFYTLNNGLSSYNISSIAQDKYGFMWIATQDGLNFFDGTHFKIFNKNSNYPIGGNDIRTLIYDSKNNLVWAAFSYGGLSAIDCQTHKAVTHLAESRFTQVSGTSNIKSIWLTRENTLMVYSDKACHIYNKESGEVSLLFDGGGSFTAGQIIQAVADDKDAYYLMVKNKGIIRLSKQQRTLNEIAPRYSNHREKHFSDFSRTVVRKGDTLFFATEHGIAFLHSGVLCQLEWETHFLVDGFSFDKKNKLWYYKEHRAWAHDNNIAQQIGFEPKTILPQTQFYLSLFFDRNNHLWMGGSEGLIYSDLSRPLFRKYHGESDKNLKISHLYDLLPSDSFIYLNDLKGLFLTNLRTSKTQYVDTSGYPFYLLKMANGDILFNNEKGFFLVQDRTLNQELLFRKYPELQKINKRLIACHLLLNDSVIVLGGEDFKGIIIWDVKNHHVIEVIPDAKNGWQDNAINSLFKKDNKTVIICQDKCITEYDLIRQNTVTHFIVNRGGQDTVRLLFDLLKYNDQYIIGTYGQGILITDKNFKTLQEINSANGLSNNSVYRLQRDSKGFLWASTNYGLNRINLSDGSVLQYFEKDGLSSDSFEEASSAQQNTELFFGGLNGFTRVQPGNIEKNEIKPDIYFINYHLKTSTKDSLFTDIEQTKIRISPRTLQSTFQFTSISYSGPEKIRYFYRITEVQDNWIKIEGEPKISLIRLAPGTYHLDIKAINEDGIESEIKQLTLIFRPKWYQTWWFKSLLALAVVAIAYALYRMRINQLKKEERIRNQLATDLHDDLGSTLNSVKVYSNLAMMEKENHPHLLKIKESTQDAIAGVRDLIWVLDDKKDTIEDLLARISQFAAPLCEANHIAFTRHIDDHLYHQQLGKEEKRNLYMIFKESINNSIKYSGCQNITLRIESAGKKISCSIHDDGKGFDGGKINPGNGLKNIRNRAREIHYHCTIDSSPGKGTMITLTRS